MYMYMELCSVHIKLSNAVDWSKKQSDWTVIYRLLEYGNNSNLIINELYFNIF